MSCSVVPQTTVILNNDRQNSIVAKMVGQEEPLSRAADSLENILSKLVAVMEIVLFCSLLTDQYQSLQQFGVQNEECSRFLGGQNIEPVHEYFIRLTVLPRETSHQQ